MPVPCGPRDTREAELKEDLELRKEPKQWTMEPFKGQQTTFCPVSLSRRSHGVSAGHEWGLCSREPGFAPPRPLQMLAHLFFCHRIRARERAGTKEAHWLSKIKPKQKQNKPQKTQKTPAKRKKIPQQATLKTKEGRERALK